MIWRRTSRRVFHSSSCGIPSPRLTLARRRRACAHTPRNVEAPPAAAVAGRRNSLHGEPHSFLLAIPSLRVAPFLTNPAGNARKTRSHERVFHSITAGFFALWLTLGAACSTLLADQMRRPRYSVVLRTPYESRRERQSKRGRQLLLLLWRFKRPNLAAKFATNRNVSLDKSKSFLQSVTHVAVGSTPIRQAIFSVTSCVE